MEDETREFENCYPDFGLNIKFDEYQESSNEIALNWKRSLEDFINGQLKIIEKYCKKDSKNDVSVYTGIAGIALLHVLLSETLDNSQEDHLKTALDLIGPCLKSLRGHRLSFLCGDAGVLGLAVVVNHKLGFNDKRDRLLESLVGLSGKVTDLTTDLPDEVLYGRAGYLFSLIFVQQYVKDNQLPLRTAIKQVVAAIFESGKILARQEKWKCPLMYKWHDKHYMGAAHGISGILFMLLQVANVLEEDEKAKLIKPTIDYLITLKFSSGNYPSSYGNRHDILVHWCHGAPGFIQLFIIAYKVFGDALYLSEAISCSDVIWKRGLLKKGYGICHGVAGNAMAFLQLFRLTADRKYLYRATKFAQWCLEFNTRSCPSPDRPMSLFEGLAGTLWFMASMLKPENAKFPAFQLW